jgi:tetratricopeptide (TPR) repeat protein
MAGILDKNNKHFWLYLFLVAVLLVLLNSQIKKEKNALVEMGNKPPYPADITAAKALLGAFREIRVTLADFAWIRVDKYFHSSITPEEHEMIHPGHPEHMHQHTGGDDNEGKDEHLHGQALSRINHDAELMPLIKVVITLDPQFLEAYRVGSWWLWKKLNAPQQAIALLQEGIQNNPDKYELNYDLGLLYFHKLNDYKNAKIQFRLASRKKMENWDRANVMEYLAFTLERLNDLPGALEAWKEVKQLNIQPYANAAQREIPEIEKQLKSLQGKSNASHP